MTETGSVMVQAQNITHYYHQGTKVIATPVLQGISLEVGAGELVAIVGASGCGKSTLLRLLAGLAVPTSGEILIAGQSPQQALADYAIGLAFQQPKLFPWWTILDNVLLPIRLRQKAVGREQRQRAIACLEQLGIGDTVSMYPKSLSGGMLQRAAIARALMGEPKVLMLDEPFSAVDEITRENLWVDFHKVWRRQCLSVILVTHSIHEAVFLADRVLVMSRHAGVIAAEFGVDLGQERTRRLFGLPRYNQFIDAVRKGL
jgi:NitT/TauT family transport system ATP-binding protein